MQAFYMAGKAMYNEKTILGYYYRRMRARLGPEQAAIATGHKIARIYYYCITSGVEYEETTLAKHEALSKDRQLQNLKNSAKRLGFDLVPRPVT